MFAKEVYINRRNVLKTKVGSGILLFLGTGEAAVNYAGNAYRYRQDSTFNYYFGLTDPDLAAIIDLESGEEIIFGNDVDIDDIIWMGPQPLISDKAASVGVSKSFPFAELEKYVSRAKAQGRRVHFLPPYRYRNMILLNQMLGMPFDRMLVKKLCDGVLRLDMAAPGTGVDSFNVSVAAGIILYEIQAQRAGNV